MKKVLCIVLLAGMGHVASAQIPIIGIIGTITKKIVVALDIHVQRLQTETLGLEVAEKKLENVMEETRLEEIRDWVERQKDLYSDYYDELWQVKGVITGYQRLKELISKEGRIITRAGHLGRVLAADGHFSRSEIEGMQIVIDGIMGDAIRNIELIDRVVKALVTSMEDGDRLEIIDKAAGRIDRNDGDLELLYQQCMSLSLMRARDAGDAGFVRTLYGIQ